MYLTMAQLIMKMVRASVFFEDLVPEKKHASGCSKRDAGENMSCNCGADGFNSRRKRILDELDPEK